MNSAPQAITDEELLARFIVYSGWVRSDSTVKSDAFIPPLNLNLSVTRHLGLNETALWEIGNSVAAQRTLTLHGRADVLSAVIMQLSLSIDPAPTLENPNHANITGWPKEKSAQKSLAQQIAAKAQFVSNIV